MSDFIDGLERELVVAARRRASASAPALRRWFAPWSLRTVLLALVISTSAASAAAAATLYTLRGSVIPAPAAGDVPPSQTPVPSSAHVSPLRAADPAPDVAPWTIRIARSDTGYVCSTVGQVIGGRFGLIGLDRRFRELAPGVVDSCGQAQRNAATLVGARTLSAPRPADVRTVISGVAGDTLRSVRLTTSRGTRSVPHAPGGAFAAVIVGYPEDVAAEVALTFADGHRQVEPVGADPSVVVDPEGGPAWRPRRYTTANDARTCVTFAPSRGVAGAAGAGDAPSSPAVCGLLRGAHGTALREQGIFLAVRRLSSATVRPDPASPYAGHWHHAPPRTAVWGAAGEDVRSIVVRAPGIADRRLAIPADRLVLAVLPAAVRPASVRVRVRMEDGSVRSVRGDTGLVERRVAPDVQQSGGSSVDDEGDEG